MFDRPAFPALDQEGRACEPSGGTGLLQGANPGDASPDLPTYSASEGVWPLRNVLRKEKKYLMDLASAAIARGRVGGVLAPDSHNGGSGYVVRSLYFDTVHDRDFASQSSGLEVRRKVRLRVYDPMADYALLELKQKQGDSQRKRSLAMPCEEARRLARGDLGVLLGRSEPFALEMYGLMRANGYLPKCVVEYDRTAFVARENSIRVTFDHAVRATSLSMDIFDPRLALTPVMDPFNVILEVKYNGFLLSYVKDALGSVGRSEISVSKYGLARAAGLGSGW